MIHYEYVSQIDGLICNFTRPWLYLLLPICLNCRALAWEGVYVYKLAFFFWLSPRTYHFLFEKRLIIDLRYFWRNIALSLILERSPDYPLKWPYPVVFSFSLCLVFDTSLPPHAFRQSTWLQTLHETKSQASRRICSQCGIKLERPDPNLKIEICFTIFSKIYF